MKSLTEASDTCNVRIFALRNIQEKAAAQVKDVDERVLDSVGRYTALGHKVNLAVSTAQNEAR